MSPVDTLIGFTGVIIAVLCAYRYWRLGAENERTRAGRIYLWGAIAGLAIVLLPPTIHILQNGAS